MNESARSDEQFRETIDRSKEGKETIALHGSQIHFSGQVGQLFMPKTTGEEGEKATKRWTSQLMLHRKQNEGRDKNETKSTKLSPARAVFKVGYNQRETPICRTVSHHTDPYPFVAFRKKG